MASPQPSVLDKTSGKGGLLLALGALFLVLVALFYQSFRPEMVLFANDAPLGLLSAQSDNRFSTFFGYWQDQNWLGIEQPSALTSMTMLIYVLFGPVGFAKFYAPIALLVLGLSAWLLFRQLKFHPIVCVLGGMAIALNTDPFSYACWGLASIPLAMSGIFLALAAVVSTPDRTWIKMALAGMGVGMAVMEGFDVGAIMSLFVAAFVLFQSWATSKNGLPAALGKGALHLAVVTFFAALIATQALSTLVGTQIKGIVGTEQDQESRQKRWDQATQWSLPKVETLRVIIPGLFGYRMDTADGGNYWGAVGQSPGNPQTRHSGSGVYGGVLVALVAAWGIGRSFVRKDNPFSQTERRFIWFWTGAAVLALLFSFGRHAPFYQFLYALPYFSTIRNPIKFMHPFHIALVILFGYGLQGLYRSYVEKSLVKSASVTEQIRIWWRSASGTFSKTSAIALLAFFAVSLMGWMLFTVSKNEVLRYLGTGGFPEDFAAAIFRFASKEIAWYLVFLGLSTVVVILILSGALSGPRKKFAGIALGVLLFADMARANLPWVVYYDYVNKYEKNIIFDALKNEPYLQRVTGKFLPFGGAFMIDMDRRGQPTSQAGPLFVQTYFDWLQNQFQYYHIQSLDISQMPRIPQLDDAYSKAVNQPQRLWELTNTRYLLGMHMFVNAFNEQFDPVQKRYKTRIAFTLAPKPGVSEPKSVDDLTPIQTTNGPFALMEFTGALPRAKLFGSWQVETNDETVLTRLVSADFDPFQTVFVNGNIPNPPSPAGAMQDAGTVAITSYAPRHVVLKANVTAPAVLLLNDRYNDHWQVWVDGKREELLRANYIMRGVALQPGEHTVEFKFQVPLTPLLISLSGVILGLGLCGFLAFAPARSPRPPEARSGDSTTPQP